MTQIQKSTRRGRPPKIVREHADTKALLIQTGLEVLTEFGFSATGLDTILKKVGVPKGSFYHYFKSKENYGLAVLEAYDQYFIAKLSRHIHNKNLAPLARLVSFTDGAIEGMQKYQFKRGCLVGNLNQELNHLSEDFKSRLLQSYASWQALVKHCLDEAYQEQSIAADVNTSQMSECFWIGWEGAVMRAKLTQSGQPLLLYTNTFLRAISV